MRLSHALRDAGATVRLEDGKVKIGNASKVPFTLMERARAEKDALVAELEWEDRQIATIVAVCHAEPARNAFVERIYDGVRAFQRGEVDRFALLSLASDLSAAMTGERVLSGRDLDALARSILPPAIPVPPHAAPAPPVRPIASTFGPRPSGNAFAAAPPEQGGML